MITINILMIIKAYRYHQELLKLECSKVLNFLLFRPTSMILCFFVFKWCTGPGNLKISTTHTEYFDHDYHHLDKSLHTFSMRKEAQNKLIFWGCCLSVQGNTPTNACIGGVYDILVHWQELRGLVGWQWACVATIGGHGWKRKSENTNLLARFQIFK